MIVDYTHILSFDPIIYGRKRSNPTPSLVYGVKMPTLSQGWIQDFVQGGGQNIAHALACAQNSDFSLIIHNYITALPLLASR